MHHMDTLRAEVFMDMATGECGELSAEEEDRQRKISGKSSITEILMLRGSQRNSFKERLFKSPHLS